MVAAAKRFVTPEQYLERERQADHKSEYLSGQIFAMAGASFTHNLLVSNTSRGLGNALVGSSCRTVSSDQRVKVSPTGLYAYPDVLVVCDTPQFSDDQQDTLLNPAVILEVLSPSTQHYDRDEKFRHYETLVSLTDYLLVSQDQIRVDHYARQGERQWLLTRYDDLQGILALTSIGCTLPLSTIHASVEFMTDGDAPGGRV